MGELIALHDATQVEAAQEATNDGDTRGAASYIVAEATAPELAPHYPHEIYDWRQNMTPSSGPTVLDAPPSIPAPRPNA